MKRIVQIAVRPDGTAEYIYDEEVHMDTLGKAVLRRASHVEPGADLAWFADMAPSGGPVLGPFQKRSDAIAAEIEWLKANVISQKGVHASPSNV